MANVSETTLKQLSELFHFHWYDHIGIDPVTPDKATHLHIGFSNDKENPEYIGKTFKVPAKMELTVDWVMNKINTESVFKNFTEHFKTLISKFNLSAYPTTYGIGVFALFNFKGTTTEAMNNIERTLNDLGVAYTTEYSDAMWVFRYKISKSAENIQLIEKILAK